MFEVLLFLERSNVLVADCISVQKTVIYSLIDCLVLGVISVIGTHRFSSRKILWPRFLQSQMHPSIDGYIRLNPTIEARLLLPWICLLNLKGPQDILSSVRIFTISILATLQVIHINTTTDPISALQLPVKVLVFHPTHSDPCTPHKVSFVKGTDSYQFSSQLGSGRTPIVGPQSTQTLTSMSKTQNDRLTSMTLNYCHPVRISTKKRNH